MTTDQSQQPQPAPEAPRLSAEPYDPFTAHDCHTSRYCCCCYRDQHHQVHENLDLTVKRLRVSEHERDEARAALVESRAGNERLRAALERLVDVDLGLRDWAARLVDPPLRSVIQARGILAIAQARNALASSPAAPTEPARQEDASCNMQEMHIASADQMEPARCEDCGSPNHLACDYMPVDGQRRWAPAPDGYVSTAEAVEFPDAASAIAWLQADEDEPAPDEGARGGE